MGRGDDHVEDLQHRVGQVERAILQDVDLDALKQRYALDLSPEMARLARDLDCDFVVDADAHAPAEFAYVPMALWMARRAGIPKERILNFRPNWH